jgi:predicted transcriptional regulator of viral defense system
MRTNLRTLGPHEAKVVLSLREQSRETVSAAEIIGILGSEPAARPVIRNLLKKGWLTRLVGGRYMFLPPEHGPENLGENNRLALAAAVIEPSYISWWAAAAFHGFTTQRPMSITVASLRQAPARTIEETEIRFVKLAERKFFGFTDYMIYGRKVAISTPVKTLVDCVDRPDLAGGPAEVTRIVYGGVREVDGAELADTALKMESTALLQRLGFLLEFAGKNVPAEVPGRLKAAIPRSARSVFGAATRRSDHIGYVAKWGLFVNATKADLLADVPRFPDSEVSSC